MTDFLSHADATDDTLAQEPAPALVIATLWRIVFRKPAADAVVDGGDDAAAKGDDADS
jgi:hypothetical protein